MSAREMSEGTAAPALAERVDRGEKIGHGLLTVAKWSGAVVVIAAALWVLGVVFAKLWVVILPLILAAIVATVLWPPTRLLVRLGVPNALAAAITTVGFIAVLAGVIAAIIPSVVDQAPELGDKASAGVAQIRDWMQGPPLNVREDQIATAADVIISKVQASASQIASGLFSGVGAVSSALLNLVVVLFLSFYFIKDGGKFMPWLHRMTGSRGGVHFEVVLARMWTSLGGFVRTQAIVSLIDAVLIGIGLVILGVPLALALTVITFFGGFVPIIGALIAGALAALVALVANGPTTALIVLAIIVGVQQFEGNVLQPMLQSRSLNLHESVVLLAVTIGGSLWGIVGVFLAVPAAATIAVVMRYVGEQLDGPPADAPAVEQQSTEDESDEPVHVPT